MHVSYKTHFMRWFDRFRDSVVSLSTFFFWLKEITRIKFVTHQDSFVIVDVNGSKRNIVSLHRKQTQFQSFISSAIFAMRKWNSNVNVYILFRYTFLYDRVDGSRGIPFILVTTYWTRLAMLPNEHVLEP